ncbi:MAG: pyridoxal phosphate-dependent aminotransferase family protein [Gemmataceae bacterium]|nr:pyridoxal phosphate-dependent aminotransferase family protein [Gemmataceae bacterium]
MDAPLDRWIAGARTSGIGKFLNHFAGRFPDTHLKDLDFETMGPGREVKIQGRNVVNFGSDSFLGLDTDPRVIAALLRGIENWGAHSGASRAFAGVKSNRVAEERLARWLGVESTVIFPSVTLANLGAIPGFTGKQDVILVDEYAHNSVQEGAKLARGSGVRVDTFRHDDVDDLAGKLRGSRPYRNALVCVDGVYSMSGTLPPLADFSDVCRDNDAVLYVDDAHGTGVLGPQGVGTVRTALGNYDNCLVVGSLSKAFSCYGGFVAGPRDAIEMLKMRANTYIFGGPVPPCYCDAICAVLDILEGGEYVRLIDRLRVNVRHFTAGAVARGFTVSGGMTPIVALHVGDEADTLRAGKFIFDCGYYVQSVIFPAVPYHAGVLRVQLNANHSDQQINGLLGALAELRATVRLAA